MSRGFEICIYYPISLYLSGIIFMSHCWFYHSWILWFPPKNSCHLFVMSIICNSDITYIYMRSNLTCVEDSCLKYITEAYWATKKPKQQTLAFLLTCHIFHYFSAVWMDFWSILIEKHVSKVGQILAEILSRQNIQDIEFYRTSQCVFNHIWKSGFFFPAEPQGCQWCCIPDMEVRHQVPDNSALALQHKYLTDVSL